MENEERIGNVENRKSKEGIKKFGIAKVRQEWKKVRLKLENKVECGKGWRNLEIEAGIEKVEDRKVKRKLKMFKIIAKVRQ